MNEESETPESSEAALAFICKRLYLDYTKLTDEGKKWLAYRGEIGFVKEPRSAEGTEEEIINRNGLKISCLISLKRI